VLSGHPRRQLVGMEYSPHHSPLKSAFIRSPCPKCPVQNLKVKGRKTELLHRTKIGELAQEGTFVIGPGEYRLGIGMA
jgi:hypothetical protein